jgi:hypothetical protein
MSTHKDSSSRGPTVIRLKRQDVAGEDVVFPWSDERLAGLDVACIPAVLASCYFPRRPVREDAILRRNGDDSLIVSSQAIEVDGKLVKPGLPYGAPARLIFTALATLAKLQDAIRSDLRPKLYLPRSARAFYRFVHGVEDASGRDRGMFVQHFYRLLATEFTASRRMRVERERCRVQRGWTFKAVRVVEEAELWWDPKDLEALPLFPSWLTLATRFWEWLDASAVPLDWCAYRGHALSPLTMDIDAWLAARLVRLKEKVFLSWRQVYEQFIGEPPREREACARRLWNFKSDFVANLRRSLAAYRGAHVEVSSSGLRLFPSPPWVDFTKEVRKLSREVDLGLPE